MYIVRLRKPVLKQLKKMPLLEQKKFRNLLLDLKFMGPIQKDWSNFSSLGENAYHCHLSHRWVDCWRNEKGSIIVEVYYAGSRENAPY